MQIDARGTSALRYYRELQELRAVSHMLDFGMNANLGNRTKLLVSQVVSYSPSYLYGLFAPEPEVGNAVPPTPDYNVDVSNAESYSYGTLVTLTRGVSRRTNISATGDRRTRTFGAPRPFAVTSDSTGPVSGSREAWAAAPR